MRSISALVFLSLIIGGCSDSSENDNDSRVAATCSRLNECNDLDGTSEQECVDILGGCVEDLPDGYQHDWGVIMDDCLDRQSCSLFGDCVVIPCQDP